MKLGARIIKTGIAVMLAIYIAELLGFEPVLFAAIPAALTVQPSLFRSWQHIIEQLQANVIGAILAVLFTYLLGNDPFVIALVIMLVIAINMQLRFEKSIPLSIMTVLAIMESTTGDFSQFAANRFILIMIGIASSVLVNAIFLPPRYEDKLYSKIEQLNKSLFSYLRCSLDELKEREFRTDYKKYQEESLKIDQLFLLYREERNYFRKVTYSKYRKLVLFRKMIQTTNHSLLLLYKIEKHQHSLDSLSVELRGIIQRELEVLTNYHEKILLKFEGKLKSKHPHLKSNELDKSRKYMLNHFMTLYEEGNQMINKNWIHLFPLFAFIVDYGEHLERLDKLVEGYHTFHQKK